MGKIEISKCDVCDVILTEKNIHPCHSNKICKSCLVELLSPLTGINITKKPKWKT